MSKYVDIDILTESLCNECVAVCEGKEGLRCGLKEFIDSLPTVDAVPVSWINKHLEWLDNCDNDFAQLAKVSIRGMLELWRKDGMLNEHTN